MVDGRDDSGQGVPEPGYGEVRSHDEGTGYKRNEVDKDVLQGMTVEGGDSNWCPPFMVRLVDPLVEKRMVCESTRRTLNLHKLVHTCTQNSYTSKHMHTCIHKCTNTHTHTLKFVNIFSPPPPPPPLSPQPDNDYFATVFKATGVSGHSLQQLA